MKVQVKLLRACINNEIPAIVFQRDDKCTPKSWKSHYVFTKNGCSAEFAYDFQLLINEMKAYQKENTNTVKIPGLSATTIIQSHLREKHGSIVVAIERNGE